MSVNLVTEVSVTGKFLLWTIENPVNEIPRVQPNKNRKNENGRLGFESVHER